MNFLINKGLDIPLAGAPEQVIRQKKNTRHAALVADDYIGMKPSMAVKEGDRVAIGQLLFTDKKNQGVKFTSPACGRVKAIHRGAKRKFESIVIEIDGEDKELFQGLNQRQPSDLDPDEIRTTLINSGMWTTIRTRPYGKTPALDSAPSSLFITAIDTLPLAADPVVVISQYNDDFLLGLKILQRLTPKTFLCTSNVENIPGRDLLDLVNCQFNGPHPAGLPSTHIHFLDPVNAEKTVWHIGYQDVIGVGYLFRTGHLFTERVVALSGSGFTAPGLIQTCLGADIIELCRDQLSTPDIRVLSGSALTGRKATGVHGYLGRFHQQICAIPEGDGKSFLGWLNPGKDRFSSLPLFLSSLFPKKNFAMNTATWGGRRAIFPVDTYEKVIPLDLVATSLLKSIATGNTDKSKDLGCLELIEEDLALCSFVCPGKNNFGPMLREVLTRIEVEG